MHVGTLSTGVLRAAGDRRPLVELYQEAIDRALWLEQLGYDFLFLGEHHFMQNQWNPSPLMLLAGLATRTSRLRLGTNVLLTPLYNPLRLAEDLAVLDNLSRGRLDLIGGSASITREFETFGIPPAGRFGRVWETLGFLRRCFAEERFDHSGRYFTFPRVWLTTRPVQQPFPVWFGGFGPKMLHRAGLEGYPAFGGGNTAWDAYDQGLREGGHDPNELNRGLSGGLAATVVASEQERAEIMDQIMQQARAHAEEYSEAGRDLAFQYVKPKWMPPLVGTPDQVLAALEPTARNSRYTHFETRGDRRHLELFAKEVMPTLRTWSRAPVTGQRTPA